MINGRKLFNTSKCWILIPLGWGNARHKYELGEEWLKSSPAERDLGVLMDSRLSVRHQRANPILGCIRASPVTQNYLAVFSGEWPQASQASLCEVCELCAVLGPP